MSATTIERKINYNMAGGDSANLFDPVNVESYAIFSLQFIVTGQAGGTDGEISLWVSNNGIDFTEVPTIATIFVYKTILNSLGNNSYHLFVGSADGVSACTHVRASFKANSVNAGIIEKMILMGNLGNS